MIDRDSPTKNDHIDALMRAALIISSFRRRLSQTGYPFREPPETEKIIADIDALVNADADNDNSERERKRVQKAASRAKKKPQSSASLFATDAGRAMISAAVCGLGDKTAL